MMRRRRRHTHSWLFLTHIYQWVEIISKLCASNYRYNLLLYVYFWWQESHYGKILFSLQKIQVLVKSSLGEKGLTHVKKAFRCSKLNINNKSYLLQITSMAQFCNSFCSVFSLLSYLTLNTINRTDGWTDIIIAPSTRSRRGSRLASCLSLIGQIQVRVEAQLWELFGFLCVPPKPSLWW